MAQRRLGQILVDLGYLTEDQLWDVLEEQKQSPGEIIGQVAIRMGLVTEAQVTEALAEQWGMPVVSLAETNIPPNVLEIVPQTMADIYKIMPVSLKNNVLTVAMADPQNVAALDDLRNFLGYDVRGAVSNLADVEQAIERHYADKQDSIEEVIDQLKEAGLDKGGEDEGTFDLASDEEIASAAPVRKLLNMVLLLAIKDQASDIHFEPFEDEFKIRVRADGVLYEMVPPPRHLANAITTRIKVMAELDIAERRLPQDGRIELNVGGNPVDLRVSVLPTMFGESVVMRVLDRTVVQLDLQKIGMDATILRRFRQIIRNPNGIVLVTGPTGSGKTTTLYSALNELNEVSTKVITTEDPIEYEIDGLIQVPVNPDIEVTFANVLRAILRHDPDVILVGEIRDYETAEIVDSKRPHRAPGLQHAAHQRRALGHHPSARHGRAALLDHGHARSHPGTAARAQDLHRVPHRVRAQRRAVDGTAVADRAGPSIQLLLRQGMCAVQQLRLQRAHRHLRAAGNQRRRPRHDYLGRVGRRYSQLRPHAGDDDPAGIGPQADFRRRDDD